MIIPNHTPKPRWETFYLLKKTIIVLLFLLAGCAHGLPDRFTDADFSPQTAQILPECDLSFASLNGKKVSLDVTYAHDGTFTIEDYDLGNKKKVSAAFKESGALKKYLLQLIKENGMTVVRPSTNEDMHLALHIKKAACILEEANADIAQGLTVSNKADARWGVIVEANLSINNKPDIPFRRIIVFRKSIAADQKIIYLLFTMHGNFESTLTCDAEYLDKTPIAHVAADFKQVVTSVVIPIIDTDAAGQIVVYNPRTGAVDKTITPETPFGQPLLDCIGVCRKGNQMPQNVLYYTTPRGYMTVLAKDLIGFVFEEMVKYSVGS
ncbi:hypothetical protein [Pseudodesulfovibrio methanolicus]|uniref:Lipoprotein n=1 Tax=Pseudodesulfovibrio methanolicus TaxID=3126690 RepID=A0ABZ2IX98_9BACT